MGTKRKFYVVWKGRQKGIFSSWEECAAQVVGYPGAEYKAFETLAAAERAFQGRYQDYVGQARQTPPWLLSPKPPIAESYCVDAACSGNPGLLEYRGVHTASGREVFRQGPFENGTSNVGEFLAIVHALAWMKTQGIAAPVYSDSEIAIGWAKRGKCLTDLKPDTKNARLFDLIARAERWLQENGVPVPLLKWDTEAWGEIPADFGRK